MGAPEQKHSHRGGDGLKAIERLKNALGNKQFPLHDEPALRDALATVLSDAGIGFYREYRLAPKCRPDFFIGGAELNPSIRHGNGLNAISGVAIEVKISGDRRKVYRQCVRYCSLDSVSGLLLVAGKTIPLPAEINGKPCHVLQLGGVWL